MSGLTKRFEASLKNIATRAQKALAEIPGVSVEEVHDLDGTHYLAVVQNGACLYSYQIHENLYLTYAYSGGKETPRSFLFDNNPQAFQSDRRVKSHKWMFEKILEHWKSQNGSTDS